MYKLYIQQQPVCLSLEYVTVCDMLMWFNKSILRVNRRFPIFSGGMEPWNLVTQIACP